MICKVYVPLKAKEHYQNIFNQLLIKYIIFRSQETQFILILKEHIDEFRFRKVTESN